MNTGKFVCLGLLLAGATAGSILPSGVAFSANAANSEIFPGKIGHGEIRSGGVRVAQIFGDAFLCAFEPFDDVCFANDMQRLLENTEPGQADHLWAFWYHTLLLSRDELILVPIPSSATRQMTDPGFIAAVEQSRAAFAGDIDGALEGARLIAVPQPEIRALLGIAVAQQRVGDLDAAIATLDEAFAAMQSIEPSRLQISIAEEIAWAQHRADDLDGATRTVAAGIAVNDSLVAPSFIKATNAVSLAGGTCAVDGAQAGIELIKAGLAVLDALPAAAVPVVVRAITTARAARGYARCGDEAAAFAAAEAAVAFAGDLSRLEKIQLLSNMIDFVD